MRTKDTGTITLSKSVIDKIRIYTYAVQHQDPSLSMRAVVEAALNQYMKTNPPPADIMKRIEGAGAFVLKFGPRLGPRDPNER
jgi:hypothetical protein